MSEEEPELLSEWEKKVSATLTSMQNDLNVINKTLNDITARLANDAIILKELKTYIKLIAEEVEK